MTIAVTVLTANPAAGAAAGAAATGALNNTGPNSDRRKNSDGKKPSAPPPSNPPPPPVNSSLPSLPTYHPGPTPPISEPTKSFTLTPSEINAGRPSTFDPTPYVWTPPSTTIPDMSHYLNSQEYQSLVRTPQIQQQGAEHNFSQYPRINPENRFSNQSPSISPSTTGPSYSPVSQLPLSLKSPYTTGLGGLSNTFPSISPYQFRLPTGSGSLPPTVTSLSISTLSHQELGQRALAAGNYPQAVQDFNRAIETKPTNPLPYLEREGGCPFWFRAIRQIFRRLSKIYLPNSENVSIIDS